MLRPDQKAAAQMAWQNFTRNQPGKAATMTIDEDQYLLIVEQLEKSHRLGLISASVYDQRLTTLLRQPELATEVVTFVKPKRSTAALFKELKNLHQRGILDDEQYAERKEELAFERPDFEDPDDPTRLPGGSKAEKDRLRGYLEELRKAGVLEEQVCREAHLKLDEISAAAPPAAPDPDPSVL